MRGGSQVRVESLMRGGSQVRGLSGEGGESDGGGSQVRGVSGEGR